MASIKGRDTEQRHLFKVAKCLGDYSHCARCLGHIDEKGTLGAPRQGMCVSAGGGCWYSGQRSEQIILIL